MQDSPREVCRTIGVICRRTGCGKVRNTLVLYQETLARGSQRVDAFLFPKAHAAKYNEKKLAEVVRMQQVANCKLPGRAAWRSKLGTRWSLTTWEPKSEFFSFLYFQHWSLRCILWSPPGVGRCDATPVAPWSGALRCILWSPLERGVAMLSCTWQFGLRWMVRLATRQDCMREFTGGPHTSGIETCDWGCDEIFLM